MKIFSASLVALLIIFQSVSFAEVKTFSASGEYTMSDYDTPEIAERRALEYARRNAVEQAGIYLETYSRTADFQLEQDEIKTVASDNIKILDEPKISREILRGGVPKIRVDIKASVDTATLDEAKKKSQVERQQAISQYDEMQQRILQLDKDTAELKRKIAELKDDVKDDDLLVEQERINRKALFWQYFYSNPVEAMKLDPKNPIVYLFLHPLKAIFTDMNKSEILLNHLKDINKAIILVPNDPAYYKIRGQTYVIMASNIRATDAQKDSYSATDVTQYFNKALENFNMAVEVAPNDASCYIARGKFYKKDLEDYDNAVKDYESALKVDAKAFEADDYKDLGDMYEKLKNFPDALASYTKYIELSSNPVFLAHGYKLRANIYRELGEYDKALADCDTGLVWAEKTNDNFWISSINSIKKDVTKEKTLADKYGNIDITNAAALIERADKFYSKVNKYELAIEDYMRAISIDPNILFTKDWAITAYIAGLLAYDRNAALEYSNKLIKLNPKSFALYSVRGLVYEKLGDTANALADYEKAYKIDPTTEYIKKNIMRLKYPDKLKELESLEKQARNFRKNKDYKSAVEEYTKLLKLAPEDLDALYWRAWCYDELGDYQKVLSDLNRLIEINPNYGSNAYNNRGVAYDNLGDLKKALADFEKAIELDPNNELAKKNRQRVLNKMKK